MISRIKLSRYPSSTRYSRLYDTDSGTVPKEIYDQANSTSIAIRKN